jgi:hypothetical protein
VALPRSLALGKTVVILLQARALEALVTLLPRQSPFPAQALVSEPTVVVLRKQLHVSGVTVVSPHRQLLALGVLTAVLPIRSLAPEAVVSSLPFAM